MMSLAEIQNITIGQKVEIEFHNQTILRGTVQRLGTNAEKHVNALVVEDIVGQMYIVQSYEIAKIQVIN